MYEVDKRMLYDQAQGLTPDIIPQVFIQMVDSTAKIQGQLTANKKALLEAAGMSKWRTARGLFPSSGG